MCLGPKCYEYIIYMYYLTDCIKAAERRSDKLMHANLLARFNLYTQQWALQVPSSAFYIIIIIIIIIILHHLICTINS